MKVILSFIFNSVAVPCHETKNCNTLTNTCYFYWNSSHTNMPREVGYHGDSSCSWLKSQVDPRKKNDYTSFFTIYIPWYKSVHPPQGVTIAQARMMNPLAQSLNTCKHYYSDPCSLVLSYLFPFLFFLRYGWRDIRFLLRFVLFFSNQLSYVARRIKHHFLPMKAKNYYTDTSSW